MDCQDPTRLEFWLMILAMELPLVSFLVIFLGIGRHRRLSLVVSLIGATLPLLVAWYMLFHLADSIRPIQFQALWMAGGQARVTFGFLLDPLSLVMLAIVTTISFLVQVYSLGYMADDSGITRYYSFLSLFAWSMIGLVVASGLMQLYISWELVGLSSYLLIGFYHHKFSATQAGKKAFVMTRLGDLGFFLGIVILLLTLGDLGIRYLDTRAVTRLTPNLVTLTSLLIFCGVVGKSAQFPLLTWLPDAMEGPTPVSALLHSATMVAAGVYLVSRLFPFFQASTITLGVVLAIGTITMLLSSSMAMVARDIKQVWAYSTISQLGFMLMGLGAGSYLAGVFHLTTHAAFKALLFLCSGVFIHHCGTNDFFIMSERMVRRLKVPIVTITIAGCGLAGVFPISGFFSKEAVLGALAELPSSIWLLAGLLGAAMTAYYTFRCLFVLWRPSDVGPDRASTDVHAGAVHHNGGHHAEQGGYWAMAGPLVVLAVFTLVLGWSGGRLGRFIHWGQPPAEGHHAWLAAASIILVAAGAGLAWFEFGRKNAARTGFLSRWPAVETLFAQRWYMDHFFRWFLDEIIYGIFSRLFTLNDRRVVDGGVDGLCRGVIGGGWLLSFIQSGKLQYNLFFMVLAMALIGLYFIWM